MGASSITRGLALAPNPVALTLIYGGDDQLDVLLINSQVFLSIALPFATPLILFTSSKEDSDGEDFVNLSG